ncbi:MAG: protein translocase subunit SecD, partial [Patescibacteria group bacterium]|nr:protein translocase subunit SecD [Patescibacteria group bacterium]
MKKKKVYIILFVILIFAFFAGNLSSPKYFNQGADFLSSKLSFQIPHFWQIPFKLGLDLQGGVHLVYQADLSN